MFQFYRPTEAVIVVGGADKRVRIGKNIPIDCDMRLFSAHPFNNNEGYKVSFYKDDHKGILASCVIMFHGLPLNA